MYKALIPLAFCLIALSGNDLLANDSSQTLRGSENTLSPRIVGGFQTSISQVPATVALLNSSRVQLDGNLFQAQFCGGSVIAPRWVLTAAHCVVDVRGNVTEPNAIQVLTGSADLDNPVNQPISVIRVIAHPDYRSVEQGRDIALLQLEIDAQVEAIPLDAMPIAQDQEAFIAGWGAVNTGEEGRNQSFPKQLRGAFVNMTPGQSCGTLFPDYSGYTDETTICAGVSGGGKDSCQGDSGGPMYRVDDVENRVSAVTGVTSWGIGCGEAKNPGIYTNVGAYIDWIQGNLRTFSGSAGSPPPNDGTQLPNGLDDNSSRPSLANPVSTGGDDSFLGGASLSGLLSLIAVAFWRVTVVQLLARRRAR